MSTSPLPAKRKRVRTETQMDRKRLADRTKHKENRLEGKNRLERIENEVSEIKAGLQSMMQQLQSMQAQHSAPALFGHEASTAHGPAMLGPSVTHAAAAAHLGSMQFTTQHAFTPWPSLSPSTSSPWPWASAAANPATRLWTHVPRRDEMAKVINCRCGLQHLDRFDTIDQCNVTTLYQHHIAFAPQSPTPAEARSQGQGQSSLSMSSSPSSSFELPRNPSLPAMMLHSPEENLATYFITGFLREYRNKSMEQLLAFYLLGYRYMRWRLNPSEETVRDVPPWLMPTALQRAHPHPVVVDYIPWPALRDYLCLSGNGDARHSINFYFESVEFDWPAGSPLFGQGKEGQIALSPEFEVAVMTLANWRLGPPWSEAFPDLAQLISAQT